MQAIQALLRPTLLGVSVVLAVFASPRGASAQVAVNDHQHPSCNTAMNCRGRSPSMVYTTAEGDAQRAQTNSRVDSLASAVEKRENDREERLKLELKQSLDSIPAQLLRDEIVRLIKDQVVEELVARIRVLEAQVEELRRRGPQ
jgi:hypothetical protein